MGNLLSFIALRGRVFGRLVSSKALAISPLSLLMSSGQLILQCLFMQSVHHLIIDFTF